MTTLYKKLLVCKKKRSSNRIFNLEITNQLLTLLYCSCGIDLSSILAPFVQDIVIFGKEMTIDYKFKYGTASVNTQSDNLNVVFSFSKKKSSEYYLPFNANRCVVQVDNDLNFKMATFNFFVTFSTNKITGQSATVLSPSTNPYVGSLLVNDPNYGTINIKRIIDINGNAFNEITYDSFRSKLGGYTNLVDTHLNKRFFQSDKAFEEVFMQFMKLASTSKEFYSIFPEYPTYRKFMESKNNAIDFLNLFHEYYVQDVELLKSNMLLIDMQVI